MASVPGAGFLGQPAPVQSNLDDSTAMTPNRSDLMTKEPVSDATSSPITLKPPLRKTSVTSPLCAAPRASPQIAVEYAASFKTDRTIPLTPCDSVFALIQKRAGAPSAHEKK